MALSTRYKLFWIACGASLLGLAYWKNTKSYPLMKWYNRFIKSGIDTGIVILMGLYAPALLLMYVVIWLTSPFKNKTAQVTAGFAAGLAVSHIAGVLFEVVMIAGIFAVDLVTGQVLARMQKKLKS